MKIPPSEYVKRDRGVITEILCKLCGATLQSLVPLDNWSRRINAKKILIKENYLVLAKTPTYREIKIEMRRGKQIGYHVTCVCADCSRTIKLQDLQLIYRLDVEDQDFAPTKEDKMRLFKWQPVRLAQVALTTEPLI